MMSLRNVRWSACVLKNVNLTSVWRKFSFNRWLTQTVPWLRCSSKHKGLPLLNTKSLWTNTKKFLRTSAQQIKNDIEINEDGSHILIQWDDSDLCKYHSTWLRYNCHCDSCIQAHSGQKLVDIMSIPEKPTILSATIQPDGNTVHLQWFEEPGHIGVLTLDWLKANSYSQLARNHRLQMCDYSFLKGDVKYFDHEQVISCKETFLRYLKCLNEYGVCVVDGIPTENEENKVLEIAKRLGGLQNTLYGDKFHVKADERPINIAYTTAELDFHMDLAYYESSPGLQLLHCTRFDDVVVGGESILLDIFHVAEELRERFPDDFETLCRVPATFQKVHFERENPAAYKYQRPHINIHPVTKHVTAVTWSPPFEGVLHVQEEDVEPYYCAYRRFTQLMRDSNHKKELRLQPGQCLVFNNRRILHGRRGFELNGGQRHMIGCYVNIDDFKNTVQVEHLKQGTGELARRVGNQCLF